jgi:lipopolysaccharide export system protein LptA
MRRRSPDLLLVMLLAAARVADAQVPDAPAPEAKPAEKAAADEKPGGFMGLGGTRSKEPITITSDNLEYQYNDGIVVYRGDVLAVQGELKVRSNELRITLVRDDDANGKKGAGAKAATDLDSTDASKLKSVVATGSVRIDQGARWAVGGKATFEQSNRTLVLTENPVLHDGPNEVIGERVIVFLDEDRSVVEGGRKRVKAVLFPGKDGAEPGATPGTKATSASATKPAEAKR